MNAALINKNRLECIAIIIFLAGCLVFRTRIGNTGVGYIFTCLAVYETAWLIFGEKLSETLGRILRSKYSKDKYKSARLIWRYSTYMNLITGAVVFILIVALGSYIIVNIFGLSHARYLIYIFGLIFMLRLISENLGGYLCGRKFSGAVGFSSIIRQIAILVLGNIFASLLSGYGLKAAALLKQDDFSSLYGCLGIALSAAFTEILIIVFLLIAKLAAKRRVNEYEDDLYRRNDPTGNVFLMIWRRRILNVVNYLLIAFPFIFGVAFLYLKNRETNTPELIGLFTQTVFIPPIIFCMFGLFMVIMLVLKTVTFRKRSEMGRARGAFQTGFHLCFIYGAFGCAYLIAGGEILAKVFGSETVTSTHNLLVVGGFCALFTLVTFYMLKIIMNEGFGIFAYIVQIPADIIFAIIINTMVSKGRDYLIAFSIAYMISLIVKFAGYLIIALARLDMTIDPVNNALVPVLVGAVVGVLNYFLSKVVSPHLGNLFTALFVLIEMIALYVILLLLSRNFRENELEYLPGSRLIRSLGQTFHVL